MTWKVNILHIPTGTSVDFKIYDRNLSTDFILNLACFEYWKQHNECNYVSSTVCMACHWRRQYNKTKKSNVRNNAEYEITIYE